MWQNMMTPVLALIVWTFVIELWMYVTRFRGMSAAGIDPVRVKRKDELDVLPVEVKQVADNFGHLHEQPTVFYALVFYSHLAGVADATNAKLAWSYLALRLLHSLVHCTRNFIPARFALFVLSSFVLLVIAARNAAALCSLCSAP